MKKTRISSKGWVIIPKSSRDAHHWEAGQELLVVDIEEGILLKTARLFKETTLDQVAGCLLYSGEAKTLDEMDDAIGFGARRIREESDDEC